MHPKALPETLARHLKEGRTERAFIVERQAIDETARTATLAFASETPYERYWGVEILDCTSTSMRTDRKMVGTLSLDLTAAQEVSMMASVKANTTQSVGFVIGSTTGNKIMLHAPAVQLINPKKEDFNGMRLIGFDMRILPVTGNDELRIVSL